MNEQEYIETFLEGAILAPEDRLALTLSHVWSLRRQIKNLQGTIELMDEVARDSSLQVKCRSCEQYYEIPCELSEFDPDMSYCGKDQYCTP